jgi:hypothetical protein
MRISLEEGERIATQNVDIALQVFSQMLGVQGLKKPDSNETCSPREEQPLPAQGFTDTIFQGQ